MGMSPRLLRPRLSGFNPRSISGLAQWLDANDAGTITLASGAVSGWADKSGNGLNASQATAANRPTTTTVNGKTALLFDGVNDGLDFTGVARTEETWIIAAAQTAAQTGQRQLLSDGTDGNGLSATTASVMLFEVSFGGFTEGTDRLRVQWSSNASTPLGPAVFSAVRSSAAGGFVYINGTQRSGAVSPFASSFSTAKSDTMSKIGYYSPSLFQFNGWIGEILCYSRALTASERISVERYLGGKWGVTIAPQVSNADAQDWINRAYSNGGSVSTTTATAVNTFCNAIDAAGIRNRFYRLNLFCGTGLNACLVPLYRGPSLGGTQYGNATDTNNGPFVEGDYDETGTNGGLKPNQSTKYLNTGFLANSLTQSGRHMSVWTDMTTSLNNRYWFGTDMAGCGSAFWAIGSSSTTSAEFRCGVPGAGSIACSGKVHILVSGNGNAASYLNGAASTTVSGTAFTAPAQAMFVGALNRCNTPTDYGASRMAAYSIGDAMTASQASAFYTALAAFQSSLSRT